MFVVFRFARLSDISRTKTFVSNSLNNKTKAESGVKDEKRDMIHETKREEEKDWQTGVGDNGEREG